MAAGMNDYLAKPHSIEQLGEVLEANLKAATGGGATAHV